MLKSFRLALMASLGVTLSVAVAQPPTATAPPAPPSFAQAFEAAWAQHPASRSAGLAREAVSAQQSAAARLLPEPASLGLGYRADKPLGSGQGARETEAEIALPLWLPGQRDAARRVADAAAWQLDRRQLAQRWQLAGELRELWWQARLADAEAELAAQQLQTASALVADVDRRVKAGDLARVDLNQAQSAEQSARINLGNAQALQASSLRQWATLTGLAALPALPEVAAGAARSTENTGAASADTVAPTHPALAALQARAALAAATANQARAGRYANPELSLGLTRDRGATGEAVARTTRIGLRIPLGSNPGADIDALRARTDQAEAEAELALQTSQLAATLALAQQDRLRRGDAQQLAQERLRLAEDTQALQQRAFQLGHIDLSTRLRAQADRADAELQTARAGIELQRAASRLNQALGLVP